MVVCSFFGHYGIYDTDLADKLQKTVNKIVDADDIIEFWLHPDGDFFRLCLLAVLQVKGIPGKAITVTFVYRDGQWDGKNRSGVVDQITVLPDKYTKHIQRWMAQHSTHMVSYWYEDAKDMEWRDYKSVVRNPKLNVQDVTNEKTRNAISRIVAGLELTQRQQTVLQGWNEGRTLKEIAGMLGVSSYTVKEDQKKIQWKIQKSMDNQLERTLTAEEEEMLKYSLHWFSCLKND